MLDIDNIRIPEFLADIVLTVTSGALLWENGKIARFKDLVNGKSFSKSQMLYLNKFIQNKQTNKQKREKKKENSSTKVKKIDTWQHKHHCTYLITSCTVWWHALQRATSDFTIDMWSRRDAVRRNAWACRWCP